MVDIMKNKFPFEYAIITAGCSYTLHLETTQSLLIKNKCKVFFLGAPSSSIEYTKQSIFEFVNYLLDGGILSENIFVLSNLTQFGRRNYKIPSDYVDEFVNILKNRKYDFPSYNKSDIFGFKMGHYPMGYFYLNGNLYSSLTDPDLEKIPNKIYNSILEYEDNHYNKDVIQHMIEYIDNLLDIQKFLKQNKIDYKFYFMNDIFEGWYNNGIIRHIYTENVGKFEVPDLKKYGDISNLDDVIKDVFSLIDFDNIISYKTDKFNYGGLDEYTITKFNFTDFISTTHFKTDVDYKKFNFIGQHPMMNVTTSFENELILPHLQSFLNKML